jgi:hypothetical protein
VIPLEDLITRLRYLYRGIIKSTLVQVYVLFSNLFLKSSQVDVPLLEFLSYYSMNNLHSQTSEVWLIPLVFGNLVNQWLC